MSLAEISNLCLVIALILYVLGFFGFVISIVGKKWSNRDPKVHQSKWSRFAFMLSLLGVIAHLSFFFTRWISSGHIPTSNMFEFLTFLSMMIMIAFLILYLIYK